MARKTGKYYNCLYCDKLFYVPGWRNKYNKIGFFCQHSCYAKWKSEHQRGFNHPTFKGDYVICESCNKKFIARSSRLQQRTKYCSYKCYYKSFVNRVGDKASNWQGGLSFEPYSAEFNDSLKRHIRKRDNHTCQNCGKYGKGSGMNVHHIDYNKLNNKYINLILLWAKCNVKANGNREYWTKYFQEIIRTKIMRLELSSSIPS